MLRPAALTEFRILDLLQKSLTPHPQPLPDALGRGAFALLKCGVGFKELSTKVRWLRAIALILIQCSNPNQQLVSMCQNDRK